MSKYQPNLNKILVRLIDRPEESKSPIIKPETVDSGEPCRFAKVIAVGGRYTPTYAAPEAKLPFNLAVGDTIILSKYGGVEIDQNGKKLVVSYDDVLLKEEK